MIFLHILHIHFSETLPDWQSVSFVFFVLSLAKPIKLPRKTYDSQNYFSFLLAGTGCHPDAGKGKSRSLNFQL